MSDLTHEITTRVKAAYQAGTALNIVAGGTKSFLGRTKDHNEQLSVSHHRGIVDYDPAELVMVARAGTALLEIETLLAEHGQMLGFEPPFVNSGATLGGAVAAGLAGPRRAYSGGVRDFVLGAKFVNGKGEVITVGGKVMKNVAGFDLFRPMAGSMGTLGVLLEVSLRLIPKPPLETTVMHAENSETLALEKMSLWAAQTQSISAAVWDGEHIRVRLSGTHASVEHDHVQIGGDLLADESYWQELNNFTLNFFQQTGRLWRVSVAPMSAPLGSHLGCHPSSDPSSDPSSHPGSHLDTGSNQLIDWGGAQRWLKTETAPDLIRKRASELGGHAECFSSDQTVATYHPLAANMLSLSQRFKAALDPAGILNPGRMYAEL